MSKSKPDTCIFIHDSEEEVVRKIKKAQCPPKQVAGNPITEMVQFIVFDMFDQFKIERDEKFGGDLIYNSYESFKESYLEGAIHPLDLKMSLAKMLNDILKPSIEYFDKHQDLVEEVKSL